jgi:hypothetical protein
MLKRHKPMSRGTPKRYVKPEREPIAHKPLARRPNYAASVPLHAQPKEAPAVHEGYRRLVAARPCFHCGKVGHSQAAHADQGKGLQIKSDDRTCFPLCATTPTLPGCHDLIGAGALMAKMDRREYEIRAGAATRSAIVAEGLWPADLPLWEDELVD